MIINKLKLKNFRSYEGEAEFNFSSSGNKNIVLIGGENGAGKSTLFEAIKLCIYGPVIYGYQGFIPNYIQIINSNINHNALKVDNIHAYIALTITVLEGSEEVQYELTRSWMFKNKKLAETFDVLKNGYKLENEALDLFDEYLRSLIPPNLFDFFFFDGEELSEFFSGRNAGLHLKEAILKLCNYDTLDQLKKQLLSYRKGVSKNQSQLTILESGYTTAVNEQETLLSRLEAANNDLQALQMQYENYLIDKNSLDEGFRKAGGLVESEKLELKMRESELENERTKATSFIKEFCITTLPFLLVSNKLIKIKRQIASEESLSAFQNVKSNLTEDIIKSALLEGKIISEESPNISKLPHLILSKLFDMNIINDIKNIHQLSADDKNNVIGVIDKIINEDEILRLSVSKAYNQIATINNLLKEIRSKIESSVSEDLLARYLEKNLVLNEKVVSTSSKIQFLNAHIIALKNELSSSEYKIKRLKNIYLEAIQANSTLEHSHQLEATIDELLTELTKDKLKEIESNFIYIFQALISKVSYIDDIEISEKFEVNLYVNRPYSSSEIYNLLNNLGTDEIEKRYGKKFIQNLTALYGLDNKKSLLEYMKNNIEIKNILLKTKVNINNFSKGEKQIFILCLIWALVKSSGVEIPFIIDTPYARIDETHRASLTNTYLPNISKQVIIFSTNEEIDNNLYHTIKPYISDEYILLYQSLDRKTVVNKGYFFGV